MLIMGTLALKERLPAGIAGPDERKSRSMLTKRITVVSRLLLIAALVAIFALATTRFSLPVGQDMNDKAGHLLAFFALALLVDFSWPATGFRARKVLSLLGYGLAIEVVQYFLPYRSFSLLDLGADAAGLFLYGMTVPLLKNLFPFKARWEVDIGR
jgi:VanZ family protein